MAAAAAVATVRNQPASARERDTRRLMNYLLTIYATPRHMDNIFDLFNAECQFGIFTILYSYIY